MHSQFLVLIIFISTTFRDHGQIVGEVLVYKHPGLHFGDIHRFSATYIEELPNFVGNSKFSIFFPAQGPRSAADEMANSDFDGDMYWVSLNSKVKSNIFWFVTKIFCFIIPGSNCIGAFTCIMCLCLVCFCYVLLFGLFLLRALCIT